MTVAELLASPRYTVLPSTARCLGRKSGEGVALTQQLQWWLHRWAGWPRPNVTVLDAQMHSYLDRDAYRVVWRLSDGRELRHVIDGLAVYEYARRRNCEAELAIYELAAGALASLINPPPWEMPRT